MREVLHLDPINQKAEKASNTPPLKSKPECNYFNFLLLKKRTPCLSFAAPPRSWLSEAACAFSRVQMMKQNGSQAQVRLCDVLRKAVIFRTSFGQMLFLLGDEAFVMH
jgi:hypothetical protein